MMPLPDMGGLFKGLVVMAVLAAVGVLALAGGVVYLLVLAFRPG